MLMDIRRSYFVDFVLFAGCGKRWHEIDLSIELFGLSKHRMHQQSNTTSIMGSLQD